MSAINFHPTRAALYFMSYASERRLLRWVKWRIPGQKEKRNVGKDRWTFCLFRRRLKTVNDYCSKFAVEVQPFCPQTNEVTCVFLKSFFVEVATVLLLRALMFRHLDCSWTERLKMVAGKVQMEFNLISEWHRRKRTSTCPSRLWQRKMKSEPLSFIIDVVCRVRR